MELVNISPNDGTPAIASKCNANFRRISFDLSQAMRRQARSDEERTDSDLASLYDTLHGEIQSLDDSIQQQIDGLVEHTIPEEVASQIDTLGIPDMIVEAVEGVYPPVGSYMLSEFSPEESYPGTLWAEAGSVTTDDEVTIPLWQRVVM